MKRQKNRDTYLAHLTQFLLALRLDQEIRSVSASTGVTHRSNTTPRGHATVSWWPFQAGSVKGAVGAVGVKHRRCTSSRIGGMVLALTVLSAGSRRGRMARAL